MKITHCGVTYECDVAIKCENDNYIKLYDANGFEIVSFYDISDFSEYEITDGEFVSPGDCEKPISLSVYSIGSRTISVNDWILADDESEYYYEIAHEMISANVATCNVSLLFAQGTEFEYEAAQETGKIIIYTPAAPLDDVVIDSVQIART